MTTVPPVPAEMARFCATLDAEDIPSDVLRRASILVLDAVGNAIRNAGSGPADAVADLVSTYRADTSATIWGTSLSAVPPAQAALVNGTCVHLSDFDDTHAESGVHPSAPVVSAVLATAEALHANGRETLTAVIAGYEIATRLGAAAPHLFTLRGYHATSTCGTIAAALAVGRLMRLSKDHLIAAVGIAVSQASGVLQPLAEGSPVKAFHGGWAAHSGTIAALLAARGYTAPLQSIDGQQGFFRVLIQDGYDLARATRGLGKEWETLAIIPKPYPCCHFLHAIVDAAVEYRATHDAADIDEIVCTMPREARTVVCEPWDAKARPATGYAARFSLPFVVAETLRQGELTPQSFPDRIELEPPLVDLIDRTSYVLDDDPELAKTYGAQLEIRASGHPPWLRRNVHPLGSAARPMSEQQLLDKFTKNTANHLTAERAAQLANGLTGLAEADDVADVIRRTVPCSSHSTEDNHG